MLPHVNAFARLWGRVNHYYSASDITVDIIHDEQAYFDDILEYWKTLMHSDPYVTGRIYNLGEAKITQKD